MNICLVALLRDRSVHPSAPRANLVASCYVDARGQPPEARRFSQRVIFCGLGHRFALQPNCLSVHRKPAVTELFICLKAHSSTPGRERVRAPLSLTDPLTGAHEISPP